MSEISNPEGNIVRAQLKYLKMTGQLDRMTPLELGKLFPVMISEPDPDWIHLFQAEKKKLEKYLGVMSITRIEHIGSTAVPNLPAKPVIDIMLEVTQTADISVLTGKLSRAGYHCIQKPENPPPHLMFVKGYTKRGFRGQAFHVHMRYQGDWDEIYFRDYLITHPETAREYACLKIRLADTFKNDREGYTVNKSDFIQQVIYLAKKVKSDKIN